MALNQARRRRADVAHIQKRTYGSARTGKVTTTWQARYTSPDGRERTKRFGRKVDAENWLKVNEGDVVRGVWIDPRAGRVTMRSFANGWLEQRSDLRPTTRAKYRRLLDAHVLPVLGDITRASCRPVRSVAGTPTFEDVIAPPWPAVTDSWRPSLIRPSPTRLSLAHRAE